MTAFEQRKADVLEDVAAGASNAFLTRKYSCSLNTVLKYLKQWEVYIERPKPFQKKKSN